MTIPEDPEVTLERMIGDLWRKCLMSAREAGEVPASAVQELIRQSRQILSEHGCTKRQADGILYQIYNDIHWDGDQPTDRVFETLLDFELTEFFKEGGFDNEPSNFS